MIYDKILEILDLPLEQRVRYADLVCNRMVESDHPENLI